MHPRALGLADSRLDHVDKGGHVVVGDPLALVDGVDQPGVDHRGPGPHGGGVGGGHHPGGGQALDGQQLHLEPAGHAGLVGEQGGHVGRAVAGDHLAAPAGAAARSAMSRRYWQPSQVTVPAAR